MPPREFVTQIGVVIRAAEQIGRVAIAVWENEFATINLRLEVQLPSDQRSPPFRDQQSVRPESGNWICRRD